MSDSDSEDTSAAEPDVPQDPAPPEPENTGEKKAPRRKAKRAAGTGVERRETVTTPIAPPPPRKGRAGLAFGMLLFGLLIGLVAGFIARQTDLGGMLQPAEVTGPAVAPEIREVIVDRPITPASCITSLGEVTEVIDSLAGARTALLQADLAWATGDEDAGAEAYTRVDQLLRRNLVTLSAAPLQAAISECRASSQEPEAAEPVETPEPPSPAPTPSGPIDPVTPGSPVLPAPGSTVLPAPGSTVLPAPGSTVVPTPGSTVVPAPGSTVLPAPGSTAPAGGPSPSTPAGIDLPLTPDS